MLGADFTLSSLLLMVLASFAAGLVDAIAGGGGLIQLPALFSLFPQFPVGVLSATNKVGSAAGTSVALFRYLRHLAIPWRSFLLPALFAFLGSYIGARSLVALPETQVKLMIMSAVIGVIILQWRMPPMNRTGLDNVPKPIRKKLLLAIGLIIGFYDGFIGPGTGIFLIFALVVCAGYDYLLASASAKIINLATNLAALCYFLPKGLVNWHIAIPMAIANPLGAWVGSHLAITRGQAIIRKVFLSVSLALVLKLAWPIAMNYLSSAP